MDRDLASDLHLFIAEFGRWPEKVAGSHERHLANRLSNARAEARVKLLPQAVEAALDAAAPGWRDVGSTPLRVAAPGKSSGALPDRGPTDHGAGRARRTPPPFGAVARSGPSPQRRTVGGSRVPVVAVAPAPVLRVRAKQRPRPPFGRAAGSPVRASAPQPQPEMAPGALEDDVEPLTNATLTGLDEEERGTALPALVVDVVRFAIQNGRRPEVRSADDEEHRLGLELVLLARSAMRRGDSPEVDLLDQLLPGWDR